MQNNENLEAMLGAALLEIPCAACGKYAMTLEKTKVVASFECPACRKRTFVVQGEKACSVFSESRLTKLVRYARGKRWFCSEHPGVPVSLVHVQASDGDPRRVTLHFLCRRGSRLFGRQRVHPGTIQLDLMSLEAEMLSEW
jgi:hypothetical protein